MSAQLPLFPRPAVLLGMCLFLSATEARAQTDAVTTTVAPDAPGSVEVRGEPAGAGVLLDGKPVGQLPVTLQDVPPGVHRLQVLSGAQPEERSVMVESGQPLVVDVQPAMAPAAPAVAPAPSSGGFSVRKAWAVTTAIPWGFMATTVAVLNVAAFALLWPVAPSQLPAVGGTRPDVDPTLWRVMQWTPLAVAAGFAVLALALFALPAIPVSQWLPAEVTATPG